MKVVVLTTSYPRWEGDAAGRFVADAVAHLRAHVNVDVVSAQSFRHFGIAYGHGIVGNIKRRPWLAALVPLMLAGFAQAARDAARDADLLHAHWLPAGWVAARAGKPYVVTLHGTDAELAQRLPAFARAVLRRAQLAVAVSSAVADVAQRIGGREVRVLPNGVDIPALVESEREPPSILFAGRLSPEKGILELVDAARGLPLVVAGDGPLRRRVPVARGFVPHDELERLYDEAAVVACPSRREGFGVVCLEAMAHARPVVASAVGGLRDLVVDGETGLFVPPRDRRALRAALERLLADHGLRRQLGDAGRRRAAERFSWNVVTAQTLAAYRAALGA